MCYCPDGFQGDPFSACTPQPSTRERPPSRLFLNETPSIPIGFRTRYSSKDSVLSISCLQSFFFLHLYIVSCHSKRIFYVKSHCLQSIMLCLMSEPFFSTAISDTCGVFAYATAHPTAPTVFELEPKPCEPSPCGPNTQCRDNAGVAVCSCITSFQGNPIVGCRPECTSNDDCPHDKACARQKCVDPCPGSVRTQRRVQDYGSQPDLLLHCWIHRQPQPRMPPHAAYVIRSITSTVLHAETLICNMIDIKS